MLNHLTTSCVSPELQILRTCMLHIRIMTSWATEKLWSTLYSLHQDPVGWVLQIWGLCRCVWPFPNLLDQVKQNSCAHYQKSSSHSKNEIQSIECIGITHWSASQTKVLTHRPFHLGRKGHHEKSWKKTSILLHANQAGGQGACSVRTQLLSVSSLFTLFSVKKPRNVVVN